MPFYGRPLAWEPEKATETKDEFGLANDKFCLINGLLGLLNEKLCRTQR